MEGKITGVPFTTVVPIVPFAKDAFFPASAPCAIMPLGKYMRFPISEKRNSADVPLRMSFNSCAKGFNMIK